jgi:hypothetical protein
VATWPRLAPTWPSSRSAPPLHGGYDQRVHQGHGGLRIGQHPVHPAVVQEHGPVAEPRHLRVVRDDHPGRPVRRPPQQPQHADGRGGSSAPVGSSAKITSGRAISARAIATRCCWPPESSAGRRRSWAAAQPHPRRGQLDVGPPRPAVVQPERQRDVLLHRQLGQQVEVLEDEADALPPQHRLPALGEPGQVGAAQPDRAGRGPLQSGRALQQRRLARPGNAEHRGERTRAERQRHPVKGWTRAGGAVEQSTPPSVTLRHIGQHHGGAHCGNRGLGNLLSGVGKHVSQRAGRARSAQWCRPPGSRWG